MRKNGWQEQAQWSWRHELEGEITIPTVGAAIGSNQKELIKHKLREAWRRGRFAAWVHSDRRDAREVCDHDDGHYCADTCKRARRMAQSGGYHELSIMTGAAYSDAALACARYRANTQYGDVQCEWCDTGAVGTWRHLAWECHFFAGRRPRTPVRALQRRLGWPCTGVARYDEEVLRHLVAVRHGLLVQRFGSSRLPARLREATGDGRSSREGACRGVGDLLNMCNT